MLPAPTSAPTLADLRDAHAKALEEFCITGSPESERRARELVEAVGRAEGLRPITIERTTEPDGLGRARYVLKWQHDGVVAGQIWHGRRADLLEMLRRGGFAVPAEVP